jgi:hypothetical protein
MLKGAPVPVVESVAVTVKVTVPAVVGVPESVPAEKVSPAGSEPDVTLKERT